jgi:DNA-binding NtrC family response regulator
MHPWDLDLSVLDDLQDGQKMMISRWLINKNAFVIVMTADTSPETARKATILNVSKILYKPFQFESVLDKIIKTHFFSKLDPQKNWV